MIVHGTSRMFVPVVTAVILTAANARAQASRPEGLARTDSQSAPVPVSTLFTGIPLSKPQQDSVDAITRRYQALHEALNGEDADLRIRQRQFLALREKSRADKRALLTLAQRVIYDRNAAVQKAEDEDISKRLIAAVERRNP
jgi:hypothetical protein